ncbi:MAG: pitrilysin family protein [archaeon]
MQKVVFSNGLTVIFKHKKSKSVVIEVMVKVGSNDEKINEKGLSHLIEHMLFEGTKKRPTNRTISNEIEKIGGEFNAYTTNERTNFYVKVLNKHFKIALEVISDILLNSVFLDKNINKEKGIILKEIDLINDDPRYYQWILLQKTMFDKHPSKYPSYGDPKVIKNISRKTLLNYFQKYYVPSNIVVSVVGDIKDWKKQVQEKFVMKKSVAIKKTRIKEPTQRRNKVKIEKRSIAGSYAVMGFKTLPRTHPDSYVFDIIDGILGRGQSGRMFNEIRAKEGLAYDVGTENVSELSYGYFAIYAGLDKKNLGLVKKIILKELSKLQELKEEDLKEAKTYLEGDYFLELEDSQKLADQLLFWEQNKDAKLIESFIKNIQKVTVQDVKRVVKKYLKNHTFVVVEKK